MEVTGMVGERECQPCQLCTTVPQEGRISPGCSPTGTPPFQATRYQLITTSFSAPPSLQENSGCCSHIPQRSGAHLLTDTSLPLVIGKAFPTISLSRLRFCNLTSKHLKTHFLLKIPLNNALPMRGRVKTSSGFWGGVGGTSTDIVIACDPPKVMNYTYSIFRVFIFIRRNNNHEKKKRCLTRLLSGEQIFGKR